ncbi:MAG: hemolysin family protein [Nakamurella sp.]
MFGAIASIVLLVLASALFVAAEFSLIAARRSLIEPLAVSSARARSTLTAMDNVSVLLACAQLGITVCALVLGAVGEPAVAHLIEPLLAKVGMPEQAAGTVGLVLGLLIVVAIHVSFGEMVPKNIALAAPERTAMVLVPALRVVTAMFGPIVRGLDHLANAVVRLLGVSPSGEVASTYSRREVADFVAESARQGLLDPEDLQLIDAALGFDAIRVDTVALRRNELVTVGPSPTAADVEDLCGRSGFSRFPVVAEAGSSVAYRGYLHVRDVLAVPAADRNRPLANHFIRPLPTVPAETGLRIAIETMQRRHAHMCRVTGADGDANIVMLEDALEVLVGEVVDATRRTDGQPKG